MKVTKSLAELQKEHVVLELECIDRMFNRKDRKERKDTGVMTGDELESL